MYIKRQHEQYFFCRGQVGNIYRKAGPCGWVEIVRVQMPGHENYDGGFPGCSVQFSTGKGRFERRTWFCPAANDAEFEKLMAESNRKLVSFNGISNSGVNNPLESLVRATFNGENNGTFR